MGFKPTSRTIPSLANTRCTFQSPFLSLLSRSITTGPSDEDPSPSSPSFSSPSSSPSQQAPRGPPRYDLNPPNAKLSNSSRQNLIRSVRNAGFAHRKPIIQEITQAELEQRDFAAAVAKQNTRKWKAGDVYAPHDLSSVEMEKWKKKKPMIIDAFEALDLDPRKEYKNYSIMWEYVSKMGRIKHPRETGLGNVNQRRLAKAIRRSRGMGLMPSVHNHPEVLETEAIEKHAKAVLRR